MKAWVPKFVLLAGFLVVFLLTWDRRPQVSNVHPSLVIHDVGFTRGKEHKFEYEARFQNRDISAVETLWRTNNVNVLWMVLESEPGVWFNLECAFTNLDGRKVTSRFTMTHGGHGAPFLPRGLSVLPMILPDPNQIRDQMLNFVFSKAPQVNFTTNLPADGTRAFQVQLNSW